jgi:hypothetical protein
MPLQQKHAIAKCRLGAAPVRVHSEHTTAYHQRICVRCSAEAVDSVHHLLLVCDQADQADLQALAQRPGEPGSAIKDLVTLAYGASKVESLASYTHDYTHEVMRIAQADQSGQQLVDTGLLAWQM